MRIAIYPALEPFPRRSCRCLINQILSQCLGSVPGILFILSPTFPRLGMSISLGLMLLLNMTGSYDNLSSGNHLGRREACVEFNQESHT